MSLFGGQGSLFQNQTAQSGLFANKPGGIGQGGGLFQGSNLASQNIGMNSQGTSTPIFSKPGTSVFGGSGTLGLGTQPGVAQQGFGQGNLGTGQGPLGIGQPNLGIGQPNLGIGQPNLGMGQQFMGNQMGSMMYGGQVAPSYQGNLQQKPPKFSLSFTNSNRTKPFKSTSEMHRKFFEQYQSQLDKNRDEIQLQKEQNKIIFDLATKIREEAYVVTQKAKLFSLKLKQTRKIIDSTNSEYFEFDRVTKSFEMYLTNIHMGRVPTIELPAQFIVQITQYFTSRIEELKRQVYEIEALLESSDFPENSDDYEKIILTMDEFYKYFLNISTRLFEAQDRIDDLKNRFIQACRAQGYREVDKYFEAGQKEMPKKDLIKDLERISNELQAQMVQSQK